LLIREAKGHGLRGFVNPVKIVKLSWTCRIVYLYDSAQKQKSLH